MAEAIGLLAGTAQLLVCVADLIGLALDLRDELLKGPRRIRDHIRCLDSTISILEAVDRDNLKPTDTIHGFLLAVDQSIKALQRMLQKQLRNFTKGSFRKLLSALNTIKSEDKINGAFSALERAKTNLHLHIAFKVDRKLDRLIPSGDMATDAKSRELETSENPKRAPTNHDSNDKANALGRQGNGATAEDTRRFSSTTPTDDIPAGNESDKEHKLSPRRRKAQSTAARAYASQLPPDTSAERPSTELQASAWPSLATEYKPPPHIAIVSKSMYKGRAADQIGHQVDSNGQMPDIGSISMNLEDTYEKDTKRQIGHKLNFKGPGSNKLRRGQH